MSVDRGFTWMDDETVALIDIWGKDDVQLELNGSKRNFAVYERIARELSEVGFSRTAYQCREKIKRLRKEYQIAKYCVQHNISQKKPMKHFELVDHVFNREVNNQNVDEALPCSDQEDELHFAFNPEHESDASNSCNGPDIRQLLAPGPSSSTCNNSREERRVQVPSATRSPLYQNDSNDTLIANGEDIDGVDKDSTLEDCEPPWVPNIVLVEKDHDESVGLNDACGSNETVGDSQSSRPSNMHHLGRSDSPDSGTGDEESPSKKKRMDAKRVWFKKMLDKVTDKFVTYQEQADERFLERVTSLEQLRLKRDEEMQRLWMEFEERRRKEEQQHELKMMMLFGQFINQMLGNEIVQTK